MSRKNTKKQLIRLTKHGVDYKKETNDQAINKVMKGAGQFSCHICPPWKYDNQVGRKNVKHGSKKPKYKNKRG